MIKERTGAIPLPINIPIGSENNFEGIGDAIVKATNEKPLMPEVLNNIFYIEEKMTIIENDSKLVKSNILKHI